MRQYPHFILLIAMTPLRGTSATAVWTYATTTLLGASLEGLFQPEGLLSWRQAQFKL